MQIKAEVRGEVTVVHVSGHLSLESNVSFREACLKAFSQGRIVFSLKDLQFVGSSGIQSFFKTIVDVGRQRDCKVAVTEVNSDFMKILDYVALPDLEITSSVELAVNRFAFPEFLSSNPHSSAPGTKDSV